MRWTSSNEKIEKLKSKHSREEGGLSEAISPPQDGPVFQGEGKAVVFSRCKISTAEGVAGTEDEYF